MADGTSVRKGDPRGYRARMKAALLVLSAALVAGCGSAADAESRPDETVAAERPPACAAGATRPVGSARRALAAIVEERAVAYRRPGGARLRSFGARNVNGVPTVFGVLARRVGADCRPTWYRVQLPLRPNGATGWVRATDIVVRPVTTRIAVDLSARRVTLYDRGRRVQTARGAIGSAATPTPTGRYYVNQRLVPTDPAGPFGPGAIGISAFSEVLTGWAQGGPIAIHGTNDPGSIGRAVSNGCLRLPNETLERLFAAVPAGTPVVIRA